MAANDYFNTPKKGYTPYRSDQAPSLPPLQPSSSLSIEHQPDTPVSPMDSAPLYDHRGDDTDSRFFGAGMGGRQAPETPDYIGSSNTGWLSRDTRQHSDEIPLRENPQKYSSEGRLSSPRLEASFPPGEELPPPASSSQRKRRTQEKQGFFAGKIPWVVYFLTLVQCTVFIAELVKNSILTGIPIEIHPQVNPMLGPSFSVLINMGARYVPCMKNVPGIPLDTRWPCPNTTSSDPTNPSNQCTISELCGFQPFGTQPDQWYRFIVPMFLHAGFIHIGFNMLLQLTLGKEIEQIIGSVRFLVVYLSSGIFGFVLGGNFAASGIASTGASGSLFGIIAINLLDLLYTWNERVSPKKELALIILDIVVSFALGLLPGLDNFSHIGGFLMGLVLGICLLHSPNRLRMERTRIVSEPSPDRALNTKPSSSKRAKRVSYKSFAKDPAGFFRARKPLWWVWWVIRAGALLGVLVSFVVLLNNFYMYHETCSWCIYLSCINVNNWCDMGNLTSQITNVTTTNPSRARDLLGLEPIDLSAFM